MRHFVLTRMAFSPKDWTGEESRRRLEITAATVAPSLAAQTMKDFTWVALLHADDELRAEREAIVATVPGAVCIYMDGDPAAMDVEEAKYMARRRGQKNVQRKVGRLLYSQDWRQITGTDGDTLTTRIDDDDAFREDAMERVRAAFEADAPTTRSFYVIPEGYRIHDGRYDRIRHERNAMVTCYAPPGDDFVVYDSGHVRVNEHGRVVLLDKRVGWLWIRHRDTLSGHRHSLHPLTQKIMDRFPAVDWSVLPEPKTTMGPTAGKLLWKLDGYTPAREDNTVRKVRREG